MSRYLSSMPVKKQSVFSRIIHDIKTKQYWPNSISVCFYSNYTEYTFYSSDDYDVGHGIVFGVTVRKSAGRAKCSFFCSCPSHYDDNDPMVDESDFKIDSKYAPYLISVAEKHGFSVNAQEGHTVSFTIYNNESDAYHAMQRDKEIRQKSYQEGQRKQTQMKKDETTTRMLIGVAVVLFLLYLFKS